MSIVIPPELETLRAKAKSVGLTVEAYQERLISADEQVADELTVRALEGLKSGEPIEEVGTEYWEEKHKNFRRSSLGKGPA